MVFNGHQRYDLKRVSKTLGDNTGCTKGAVTRWSVCLVWDRNEVFNPNGFSNFDQFIAGYPRVLFFFFIIEFQSLLVVNMVDCTPGGVLV